MTAATAVELPYYPIRHACIGRTIDARSAVRYIRFLREVEVERLELSPLVRGRWAPPVPTHPAHLTISILDQGQSVWRTLREAELPLDPGIAGQGLSQDMDEKAMEAHFRSVMASATPHVIDLGGVRTGTLRVECDREHPVWPSHGECNGNPVAVPFGILDSLKAYGTEPAGPAPEPTWNPLLVRGEVAPRAPKDMSVRPVGQMLLFEGSALSVGFSLRRPIMLHLGWDAMGSEYASANRLSTRRVGFRDSNRGVCGPLLVGMDGDYGSHRWTGSVEVQGNRVCYRDLHAVDGLLITATFIVEPARILVELRQVAARDIPVLEAETWRFAFSASKGMTGVAGVPVTLPGRSGDVELPALFAGDGNGALLFSARGGDRQAARLQVESYRSTREVCAGICLGRRPPPGSCLVVPRGSIDATYELSVTGLRPASRPGAPQPGPGIRRHWTSLYSCFRPELGGFSNNAVSVNCHANLHAAVDIAAFTRKPDGGPDPLELARFTVGRALAGGGGYGFWRTLYLDSDPVLVCSAGRIHQVAPDAAWLRTIGPGLTAAVTRMLGTMDARTGLSLCRTLSGNSGSFRWSCNAWDIVGFGHLDAYVNAWTYRAMRNGAALLEDLRDAELSRSCHAAAAGIRRSYGPTFVNPEEGWVAAWRSRDGMLHDCASPLVNGPACAFGLLSPDAARRALQGLEELRDRLGITGAGTGIPFTLRPLDPRDHLLPRITGGGRTEPTFECYTDGSMGPSAASYYLRALSLNGLRVRAADMARDLDTSFADGIFTGPPGESGHGKEFQTWEGLTSGYEGTFGPTFGALYAIAIEQGVLEPMTPEWWPANG